MRVELIQWILLKITGRVKIIRSSKYMNKTFEIITKLKKIDLKRHGQDELVDMLNETLGMSLKI